jgi:hypothetical protein
MHPPARDLGNGRRNVQHARLDMLLHRAQERPTFQRITLPDRRGGIVH